MNNPVINPQGLNDLLDDPNLIILDCSTKTNKAGLKSDHQNIKIKGARYFDIKNNFSDPDAIFPNTLPTPEQFQRNCRKLGINNSSRIILYDNLGIYTSPRVWWMFRVMGHKNVAILNGGLPNWVNRNLPVQDDYEYDFEEGDFKADFQREMISDLHYLKENLDNKDVLVIDARNSKRFRGEVPEPRKNLRTGNIPNSINIPFEDVLIDGEYKDPEELKLVFSAVENSNQKLIFSCGSGITACIIYVASEMVLDNPKSLYDGSWTEWGNMVQP